MTYGKLKNFAQGGMMAPTRSPVRFCQSPTDDYLETSLHSPTDSSEDSVEVKVTPITSLRNKRKCAEPRKVADTFTGPLKKRMCLKVKAENSESHPFRPWSPKTADSPVDIKPAFSYPLPFVVPRVPHYHSDTHGYFRPPSPVKVPVEEQPLPLVAKRESKEEEVIVKKERESPDLISETSNDVPRVPVHPLASSMSPAETERFIVNSATNFPNLHSARKGGEGSKREQRNYKNMTRERRIEANARERTRVHTISAAFDTLRRSVPAYSHNQKLSKLSVLRIACAYIKTLSSIVTDDEAGTSQAVSLVTATIQREGKLRKKKDDSD